MPLLEVNSSGRSLQHLPISEHSLSVFGTTPYGESLFRIIWSESRYYLVGANHVDYDSSGYSNDASLILSGGSDPNVRKQQAEYRWLPLYPSLKAWVLEQWRSPLAYVGMGREMYDIFYKDPKTGLLTLGPYPERGEYCYSFTFPSQPPWSAIERVINHIRAGWKYSQAEHKAALDQQEEKKRKDKMGQLESIFLDSQQAFKNRPSNINPAKRKRENVVIRKTAEQAGLRPRKFTLNPHR